MLYTLLDLIIDKALPKERLNESFRPKTKRFCKDTISKADFKVTEICYRCREDINKEIEIDFNFEQNEDLNHPLHGIKRSLFDVLGSFSSFEPKRINICHDLMLKYSESAKIPYFVVFDLVSIHEYAHMIHYRLNPKKFSKKEGEVGFGNHKNYVEAWAQWCTYQFCLQMDKDISMEGIYSRAFEKMNTHQSDEYRIYETYKNWSHEAVIHLFLSEDAWLGLMIDGLIEDIEWAPEIVNEIVKTILAELKANPSAIPFMLKKVFKNEKFKVVKDLLSRNPEFDAEIIDDSGLVGDLDGVGL